MPATTWRPSRSTWRAANPPALADALAWRYDIATRAGLHCAPLMHRALGTQGAGSVRFSFGYYTTQEEVDAALAALSELAAENSGDAGDSR